MQQLALTALDYVALGIMLVSALYAMARGLLHETFSIIDWLVAGYGALRLTPVLLPFAQPYVPGGLLQWLAVGLGAFLLIFIPLSIVTGRIANYVHELPSPSSTSSSSLFPISTTPSASAREECWCESLTCSRGRPRTYCTRSLTFCSPSSTARRL